MATNREIREAEKSMSSTLLEVIGPALIMLMVGSLVFFLIEVFYRGPHNARLCWVFGLFTFASVLVSRVSIESGKERGMMFGFALGLAAFITSFTLVEFEGALGIVMEPILLIVFIGVVMWSASKLTWDCTVIDKSRDTSSSGITELVRRKFQGKGMAAPNSGSVPDNENLENQVSESSDAQAGNLIKAFFTRSQRKNTPGVWVFYFAMAALPIFGIGQWFVTPDYNNGYFWVVLLFGVYLSAALALMMTTSLLGLQRYLRKRKTHMPPEIARTWLGIGTVVSIVVLAIVMVFPRPNASNTIANSLKWFTSPPRESSEMALGKDGTQQKQAGNSQKSSEQGKRSSSSAKTDKTSGNSKNGNKTQGGGGKGKGDQNSSSSAKSQQSKDGQRSQNKSGEKQSGNQKGDKQQGGGQQKTGEKGQGQSKDGQKQNQDSQSEDNQKGADDPQSQPRQSKVPDHMRPDKSVEAKRQKEAEEREKQKESQKNGGDSKQNDSKQSSTSSSANRQSPSPTPRAPKTPSMQALSQIATLITYLVAGIAALVIFVLFRKEIVAAIRSLIAELQRLLGKRKEDAESEVTVGKCPTPIKKLRPFSSYPNPFQTGTVESLAPEKVVEYTFQALEAWAYEHGLERPQDQTPHEFASMVKKLDSNVGKSAVGLCNLLCKNLFGKTEIAVEDLEPLKKLWQLMQNTVPNSSTQIAFAN